jgi:hypothetical protein
VKATANVVYTAGAIPAIIWYETRPTPVMEPPKLVGGVVENADVWIECKEVFY